MRYLKRRQPRLQFTPYVIQIADNTDVLYVNYANNISQALVDFKRKHPQIKNSSLRPDIFDASLSYTTANKANRACLRLIDSLESNGLEVIAGGPLHNPYWQVYVIEIEGNPKHIYVGETNYPVHKRFQQHIYHFNPARALQKFDILELAMHHAAHLPRLRTKDASKQAESILARQLRQSGYKVEGGH